MENPYHHEYQKPHYLDRDNVEQMCFDIFNIQAASRELASQAEYAASEGEEFQSSIFDLHHRLAEKRLSQLMLSLAVLMRTFDDLMNDSERAAEYKEFVREKTAGLNIGEIGDADLTLRNACNKIIHAKDFRPVYDKDEEKYWFMDGRIELYGELSRVEWEAVVNVAEFLEAVIDVIQFEI